MPLLYREITNFIPQFQNQFIIKINLPDELKSELNSYLKSGILILDDQVSITLPDISIEIVEIPNVSFNLKQQNTILFGEEITISIVERPDFRYRKIFETWINKIYDYIKQSSGIPKKYKQSSLIVEHHQFITINNSTIKDINVQTYRFINVYPTSIQGNDLDYGNIDLVIRDVVFRYDYFEELLFNNLVVPQLIV